MEREMLFAQARGIFAMGIIAGCFGFWQESVLAGIFMLLFLIFLEKMFRVLASRVERVESLLHSQQTPLDEG